MELDISDEIAKVLDENPQLLSAESLLYFGVTFFPHLVTSAPSDMHYELTDDAQDAIETDGQTFTAEAAPRGFAKTTWINIIFPAWCICNKKKQYILKIGSASTNAEADLENLKFELTDNMELRAAYPEACGEGPIWRQNVIVTNNGIKVEAIGASMKVRGRLHHGNRPDLIIVDDIEVDENVATPEQRTKLLRWFERAVLKAGSPVTDYFIIGTILHTESLLATLLKRPGFRTKKYKAITSWPNNMAMWDQWSKIYMNLADPIKEENAKLFYVQNKDTMDEGASLLWPERWPLYVLMEEYYRDGPYAFSSERQNDPSESDSLVTRDEIQYYEPKEVILHSLEFVVGGVDPSLGKSKKSDFSAIIHVGMDSSGYMYVLSASIRRRKPDDIISDSLELAMRPIDPWPFALRQDWFLVEAIAFQSYFRDQVDKRSQEVHAYLPTKEVHPRANKHTRICGLQPLILNGYLKFRNDGTQATLIEQLTTYPHGKDDGPDCLAMICEFMTNERRMGSTKMIYAPYDTGFEMYGAA